MRTASWKNQAEGATQVGRGVEPQSRGGNSRYNIAKEAKLLWDKEIVFGPICRLKAEIAHFHTEKIGFGCGNPFSQENTK